MNRRKDREQREMIREARKFIGEHNEMLQQNKDDFLGSESHPTRPLIAHYASIGTQTFSASGAAGLHPVILYIKTFTIVYLVQTHSTALQNLSIFSKT